MCLVGVLASYPMVHISMSGHCDEVGFCPNIAFAPAWSISSVLDLGKLPESKLQVGPPHTQSARVW
jgi:hypothetical protein